MAMYFSAFGASEPNQSLAKLTAQVRTDLGAQKKQLDWSETDDLRFRYLSAEGAMAHMLTQRLGITPQTALIARFEKEADFDKAWRALFRLFSWLGEPSILFASDGTVVAYRRQGRLWISDEMAFGVHGDLVEAAVRDAVGVKAETMRHAEIQTALEGR